MARTQYSDLVPVHYHEEYKKDDTTEGRKNELVEEVFSIIRSVNTFPEGIVTLEEEVRNLRSLTTLDMDTFYSNGWIRKNHAGQVLCYKYYPNIWDVKKNRKGIRPLSMRDAFYSDKDLKKAIRANLRYDSGISGLRSWFRMTDIGYCMNFRPSAATIIYDTNLEENARVLDYSSGYGGRILGAWASGKVSEYIGVEPNTETVRNSERFIEFLNKYPNLRSCKVYQNVSEEFTVDKYPQYRRYFDMAFSSPPYFDLEEYSTEETQSYIKYSEYPEWVKKYLRPTIKNCVDMLKSDGIFAVNMYDLDNDNENNKAPNIGKIIKYLCSELGFRLYKVDKLELTVKAGNGERSREDSKFEPIWYFRR